MPRFALLMIMTNIREFHLLLAPFSTYNPLALDNGCVDVITTKGSNFVHMCLFNDMIMDN